MTIKFDQDKNYLLEMYVSKIKPFDSFGSWAVNSSLRPKELP